MRIEIRNGADLRRVARARIDELNISRISVDDLAKLPSGYAAKLLAEPPINGGTGADSIFKLLRAIGLVVVVTDDAKKADVIRRQTEPRDLRQVRQSSHKQKILRYLKRVERLLQKIELSTPAETIPSDGDVDPGNVRRIEIRMRSAAAFARGESMA